MQQTRVFLFLQGPVAPFFQLLAQRIRQVGHQTRKINLNMGDKLTWRQPNSTDYRGGLNKWPGFIRDYYEKNGVTDLLLLGEQRDHHKVAIAIAKEMGIRIQVTDFGYLRPDWITFEANGMNGASEFPRDPDQIYDLAKQHPKPDYKGRYDVSFFNQARWDVTYHILALLGLPLFPHSALFKRHNPFNDYFGILFRLIRRPSLEPKARQKVSWLVRKRKAYFLYPLQIQHDFSLQAYSPYSGNEAPLKEIMASFARSAPADTELVIKIHPLDPSPFKWHTMVKKLAHLNGIADRVHYLDGGNLERLVNRSKGVVTVNSTTGIAALQFGTPIKTLGDAVYNIQGLIHDGDLDSFWVQPHKPDTGLRNAFLDALTATTQIKGTYYRQPGIDAAVEEATKRLLALQAP